jgi:hypothetical protein
MDLGNQRADRTTFGKEMTMTTMGAANIVTIGKMVADPYGNSLLTGAQMDIAW